MSSLCPLKVGQFLGTPQAVAVESAAPVPGAGNPRAWLCFVEWKERIPRNITEGRTGLINHSRKEYFSPWKGAMK